MSTVPQAMYDAVTDMLSEALRREIPLRAEIKVLTAEIARLHAERADIKAPAVDQ